MLVLSFVSPLQAKKAKKTSKPRFVYSGQVEKVTDGDTITVLTTDYERIKVRFYGIDAPEKKQSYGPQSTAALQKLLANQTVTVEEMDTDRYSRIVGLVRVDKQLINLAMVAGGWAWVYPQYCQSAQVCEALKEAESQARLNSVGLWGEPDPIAPWLWRKSKR
jgi:endonuclease YncB( thermonuclease family)